MAYSSPTSSIARMAGNALWNILLQAPGAKACFLEVIRTVVVVVVVVVVVMPMAESSRDESGGHSTRNRTIYKKRRDMFILPSALTLTLTLDPWREIPEWSIQIHLSGCT